MLAPQCPSCSNHFAGEEISKDLLHGEHVHIDNTPTLEPFPIRLDKEAETFEVTYRCKHCGHEWKDIVEKDI